MNIGTKIRTVLVIATCLNTALMATDVAQFGVGYIDTIYKIVSLILNFIIVACATYYNNDYTEEATNTTGMLRLLKQQRKGITDGEDFIAEFDEDEEDDEIDPEDEEELNEL